MMKSMKKQIITTLVVGGFLLASTALAAGATIVSGSIGQRSNDNSNFGVSSCNRGDVASQASVPLSVTANGITVTSQSAASIAPGACSYTYFPYTSFNMKNGQTYTVQTVTAGGASASYSITVPGGAVLGASATSPDQSHIDLLATQYRLVQQLISLLQKALGL
jgi:hypothetical protein